MQTFLAYCLFFFVSMTHLLFSSEDIVGFWQTLDKQTNRPSSVIAVYSHEGKYYGRIIGTYNDKGEIDDTIYHPKSRAPGIKGNPHYCGLDIVWDVQLDGRGNYSGYVIDPREGKIYDAKLWRSGKDLILRGEVFIFGRNVTWPPFPADEFTHAFKKPDLKKFIPSKPAL